MTFPQSYRARLLAIGGAALAVAAIVAAVLALTASAHATSDDHGAGVSVATGSVGRSHERIAVEDGRAVYVLSPETAHHRLCSMGNGCFSVWPPLTAHGAVPAHIAGLSGAVSTTAGRQLTLNGHPLYQYAGDHARDVAHGDGLKSFGGTWHVVTGADDHRASRTGSSAGGSGGSGGSGSSSGGGW